jgi:hypothetical protein
MLKRKDLRATVAYVTDGYLDQFHAPNSLSLNFPLERSHVLSPMNYTSY